MSKILPIVEQYIEFLDDDITFDEYFQTYVAFMQDRLIDIEVKYLVNLNSIGDLNKFIDMANKDSERLRQGEFE